MLVSRVLEMGLLGILGVTALTTGLCCAYLALVTLLSARLETERRSRRMVRFNVFVPAHDEAAVIARCLASLRKLDWPADRFRVIIVADNCGDSTAAIARAAGAEVLERKDPSRRGKGYALHLAFETSQLQQWADAVAVVDADSEVSASLLEAFASRIEGGAHAVQAHYGVLNPGTSWRTRLMAIAQAAFHTIRSRARERLHLSCGIRGNGWCVTRELLGRVPYRAFSLAEDVEYGIAIGLAGYRVYYAEEGVVLGEVAATARVARRQRQRWESGRFALLRSHAFELLRAALIRRSAVCLDLAIDLLVAPLSQIVLMVVGLILVAGPASARWQEFGPFLWLGMACASVVLLYVLRGWQLSGTGARGLADLCRAPVFVVWKVLVTLGRRRPRDWVRTEREQM
jgi:cellulose synthase/poly-beta-1,6-N-acetylglucosamine synthase-like glycosyltransferase